MRKLLNTLYITGEDRYLSLKNENIIVNAGNEIIGSFPLIGIEEIISFSYMGASPALMGACTQRGIHLCFLTPGGKFLARCCGAENGNVLLRREQYRIADSNERSCMIAKRMIFGKVYNAKWVIERTLRDHGMRVDQRKLKQASEMLQTSLPKIEDSDSLDILRGYEGESAAAYFGVFDDLILNQKDRFFLRDRNRHPPKDNVNAMLSFAYTLLANSCASALESVGLDAYAGLLHRDRPGRASLSLDLMEELRAPFADRLVLSMINNRIIQDKHFDVQSTGAVLLNENGRKLFLQHWQEKKREEIRHPFLKEKLQWGLVPYTQALLLARHIRGDLESYPPFLWK